MFYNVDLANQPILEPVEPESKYNFVFKECFDYSKVIGETMFNIKPQKWEKKVKTNTRVFLINESRDKQWIEIYESFVDSYRVKSKYLNEVPIQFITPFLEFSVKSLLKLSSLILSVEISQDGCICILSKIDNKIITLDLFIEEGNEVESLLNIVEDSKSICSYSGDLFNALTKVKTMLSKDCINEFESEDALSSAFISS